jgi:outer membrane protein TolC
MRRLALVVCVAALACVTSLSSRQTPAQPAAADGVAKAVRAKLDAAKQAFDLAERGKQLGLASVEQRVTWSRRWMEAERDLAVDAAGRRAAAEAHLARVKPLLAITEQLNKVGEVQFLDVLEMRYQVADAEEAVGSSR